MSLPPTPQSLWIRAGAALALAAGLMLPLAGCDDDDDLGASGEVSNGVAAADGDVNPDEAEGSGEQLASFTENTKGAEGVQTAETGEGAITIEKSVPERIMLGTPLTYQINVTAGQELKGVIVREEMPEGFAFESSTPEAQLSQDGRVLTFRLNNLKDGAQQEIQITGTPQEIGALEACTTYEIDRGVCATFEVVNPQLRLTKQGPEQAGVCEPVTYTYVLKNEGDTAAENVVLYDKLPEGLMVVEGDREVQFEIGTIQPGQEVSEQVQVMAEQPLQDAGSYAYAESNLDEVRSKRVATHFVAPALEVQVAASRAFEYIGKTASFNVTVRNTGQAVAPQTRVSVSVEGAGELAGINGQTLGEAQLASDAEPGGDITGDGMNLGALQPGESRSFTVEVATEDAGRISLGAAAVAICARTDRELAQARNAAALQVRTLSALQVYVVDKQDPVKVGEETVYELSVLNEGSGEDQNIQVSAQLPEGVSFVGADGTTEVTADGRNLTFASVPQLPPGESATWYIRVRADEAAGSTKFIANVTSDNVKEAVQTSEPTRLY